MTKQTLATLKSYFNTGDMPTEAQFHDALDSYTASPATMVVAANDAPDKIKDWADYVCDGVNDEVQIQAAIDALPAAGGNVLLSSGQFNQYVSDSVECGHGLIYYCNHIGSSHGAITIRGVPGATKLKLANAQDGGAIMLYLHGLRATRRTSPSNIFGVTFDANFTNNPSDVYYTYGCALTGHFLSGGTNVKHCRFIDPRYFGIQFCYISPNNVVDNCYFEGDGGVRSEAYNLIATNNVFNLTLTPWGTESGGVSLAPDYDENYPDPPGGTYQNYGSIVANNLFKGGGNGVYLAETKGNTITGNVFSDLCGVSYGYAMAINGSDHNTIANNTFYNISNHGIWVIGGSQYNLIAHNCFLPGQDRAIDRGIYEQTAANNNYYLDNIFSVNGVAITTIPGNGAVVRGNAGWVTENQGAASTADGGTIAHGCAATPTVATVSGSVAGEIVTVTAISSTTITVAIKKNDGSAGTTQTVYWRAEV